MSHNFASPRNSITAMSDASHIQSVIAAYKADKESVYYTWFTNSEERLKAFRSIRRGVAQVVDDIRAGTFGTDFKGSSLEIVLNSITEQKQVFEGAAHPFYWKPKLRIPDIYENESHKRHFGQFLEACLKASQEEQILKEITRLAQRNIKGLGPAVANILYFLHPTLIPPFNTAMLRGFNLLFGEKKKLGSWESYLEMRSVILDVNEQFKNLLSKDLGAISGLLFDIGAGEIVLDQNAELVVEQNEVRVAASQRRRHKEVQSEVEEDQLHAKIQYLLVKIGRSLGYDVAVAANDRNKTYGDEKFSFHCLPGLPPLSVPEEVLRTVDLIDVLWFQKQSNRIVSAFEVERSTSIYSGILRLTDLSLTLADQELMICLVAPDNREKEVMAQLRRPSLSAQQGARISYILFSDLCEHCDSICRLGDDFTILQKIAKTPG